MSPEEFAAARYRLLAEGLGDLYGRPKHGWISRTARRLEVDGSYLHRLVKGDRTTVGRDVIARAVRAVPIRREYFEPSVLPNEGPGDADWRDYLTLDGDLSGSFADARALAAGLLRAPEHEAAGRARNVARAVMGEAVVSTAAAVLAADSDARAAMLGFKLAALLAPPLDGGDPDLKLDAVSPPRILVRAVVEAGPDGRPRARLLPWPGAPRRYVGLVKAPPDTPESELVHVSGGVGFILAGPVAVPDSEYFARAIQRGDLEIVT